MSGDTTCATQLTSVSAVPMQYGLRLLGGFDVRLNNAPIDIAPAAQRLIAYLAVRGRPSERRHLARVLFQDHDPSRAANSLRSLVHRVRKNAPGLLDTSSHRVQISPATAIDASLVDDALDALVQEPHDADSTPLDISALSAEFLPGWHEDWVIIERERLRQRCLHALDDTATRELNEGHYSKAIEIALAAAAIEPLRESPQRVLIECHLREGNVSEAIRSYRSFAKLLMQELGLRPTEVLSARLPRLSRRRH